MIVLLLVFHSGISQVNLVVNPSFEDITECPDYFGQISLASTWDTLKNGGGSSPDLFSECSTFQCCSVPSNYYVGHQQPNSGIGYVGLIALYYNTLNDHKEYIQGKLIQKLTEGNTYCATMYVVLSYRSQYSCSSLGIYIDDGSIQSINYQPPDPYVNPQIVNTNGLLDDTLNWIKIEDNFIADGTEEYITIGNFLPRELSNVVHSYPLLSGESSMQRVNMAYYYIDDVSVIDMSTSAQAGNDTIIHPGESVFIGRQPEIGLNEACIWFVDGVPIDTIAGMWVTPEETTTYVLQQTLCGDIKYDTVTVVVDEFAGVFEFTKNTNEILVFPNPAREELYIHLKNKTTAIEEITIIDVAGNVYYHEQFETGVKQCGVALEMILSNGLYILEVILANGIPNRFKIMKE